MGNKFNGIAFVEKLKELSGEEKQVILAEKLAGTEDNCVHSASTWKKKISQWNNGSSNLPTTEELLRISSLYECSIDDLLGISPRKKTTTYSLLSVVDALVSSENAKIEMGEDDTTTYEDFQMILNYEVPREYVKVCNVKIYNNQLIDLLESYKQVDSMSKQNGLRSKMCATFIESEKENSTPLVSFSPDDKTFIYKAPDGGQLKFE